ncbi:MAG TPA: MYXO-CTERM sorting domain-containing protein [Polyangiaceae bacterium]|nr:MYXO-CTERM sorting domain-containing protein [Polyangiaceae bacterium]
MGPPLDVETPPSPQRNYAEGKSRIACGTSGCFQFSSIDVGGVAHTYATPIDAHGTTLSPRVAVVPGTVEGVAVNGDVYAVLANDGSERLASFDATTGTVTAPVSLPSSSAKPSVAASAVGFAVATQGYASSVVTVDVFDGNLVKKGTASITLGSQYESTTMFGGPSQFLVVEPGRAWRVDATTAQVLDSAPIVLSKYKSGLTTALFVKDHYQILWRTGADVYSARLGSDGKMIDADDDFNQVTGGRLLCTGCADDDWNAFLDTYGMFLSYAGGTLTATWAYRPSYTGWWYVAAARLDATTGLPLQSFPELSAPLYGQEPLDVTVSGDKAFIRDAGDFIRAYVVTDSPYAWTQQSIPIGTVSNPARSSPHVASNGSGYLVSWIANDVLVGTRVDASGTYLDSPPLVLSALAGDTGHLLGGVAAIGTDYVAVWRTEQCANVYSRRVGADGSLGTVSQTALGSTCAGFQLVSNGDLAMALWIQSGRVTGVRVDGTGAPVPAGSGSPILDLFATKATIGLVADYAPIPTQRTFAVFGSNGSSSGYTSNAYMHRVRARSGSSVTPDLFLSDASDARGASDGTSFLLVTRHQPNAYSWTGSRGVEGRRYDPVTGDPVGTAAVFDPGPSALPPGPVWFDGLSYVVTSIAGDYAPHELRLRRFDPTLAFLDGPTGPSGVLIESAWRGSSASELGVASDGAGHSVFAYAAPEPKMFGAAIKIRFITNDGLPSPSGTGGTSGAGGSNGSGGAIGGADASVIGGGGVTNAGGSSSNAGGSSASSDGGAQSVGGSDGGTALDSGRVPSGGSTSTGGSATGAGGASGSSTSDGGAIQPSGAKAGSDGGCGCHVGETRPQPWSSSGALGAILVLFRRRRRSGGPRAASSSLG